jgi:hypothetical protein
MAWYAKHYECGRCRAAWPDEWSCACNDRCPSCDAEIEPYGFDDLTYIVELGSHDKFIVLFSPNNAEMSPNYQVLQTFTTEAAAYTYIQNLRSRRGAERTPSSLEG